VIHVINLGWGIVVIVGIPLVCMPFRYEYILTITKSILSSQCQWWRHWCFMCSTLRIPLFIGQYFGNKIWAEGGLSF